MRDTCLIDICLKGLKYFTHKIPLIKQHPFNTIQNSRKGNETKMKPWRGSRRSYWGHSPACSCLGMNKGITNYILHIAYAIGSMISIWSWRLEVGTFRRLDQLPVMWDCHLLFQLCKNVLHGVLSLPVSEKPKLFWFHLLNWTTTDASNIISLNITK